MGQLLCRNIRNCPLLVVRVLFLLFLITEFHLVDSGFAPIFRTFLVVVVVDYADIFLVLCVHILLVVCLHNLA